MSEIRLTQALGINWDGSWRDGEPSGPLTKKERQIIIAAADPNTSDEKLKALLKPEQQTALDDFKNNLKSEQQEELILAAAKEFLKLAFQLGEAGQSLTAANLKPWRDKVKAAIAAKG